MPDRALLARALFAFVALPGIVAFVVPLLWIRPTGRALQLPGMLLAILGGVVLLACVREFYVAGRGTLAPWSPPRHLVASGLYRLSRNPMYVGVVLILLGWALGYQSRGLAGYAGAVIVAFHLRVLVHEEPWLARTFGAAWHEYAAGTPRWLGPVRRTRSQSGAG